MSKDWRVTFRTTATMDRKTDSTCRIRFFRLLSDEMPIAATWHVRPQRFDRMRKHSVGHLSLPGQRYFGCTKNGKFMCQRDADLKVIGQRASNEPFTTGSTCANANGSN
jgi:hypothetical protein